MRFASPQPGTARLVPTEPQPATLSGIARRAAEAVDPTGANDGVADLLRRLEDRDEPVAGLANLESELAEVQHMVDPQDEDPAVVTMAAVILHLSHRRDEVGADDVRLLQQAARDEFDGKPPEHVQAWLAEQGIEL
jgi:hypothetical protein